VDPGTRLVHTRLCEALIREAGQAGNGTPDVAYANLVVLAGHSYVMKQSPRTYNNHGYKDAREMIDLAGCIASASPCWPKVLRLFYKIALDGTSNTTMADTLADALDEALLAVSKDLGVYNTSD